MVNFPARGQKAPAYWDSQLKAYIDSGDDAAESGATAVANAAQTTANAAQGAASAAQTTANGASSAASTAQTTADTALSNAAAVAARATALETLTNTGRLSDAAVKSTVATRTNYGSIGAMVGDSISDRNGPWGNGQRTGVPNTTAYFPQVAWFQHANTAAGQRVYVPPTQNFAVSGKRTDEMLAQQVPSVLALNPLPSFCTVLGGTNDVGQGRTSAQVIADLDSIYTALTNVGIRVIAFTIPPSTVWDAAKLATVSTINRWIKSQPNSRRGVHVVDFFTVLADTAGAPASGVLADGTHQSAKGAAIMGAALAPVLTTLFPPLDAFPGPGDTTQLAVNPFQTGTAGAKGTGVTGSIATGWFAATADAGTVTAVGSKVARTDSIPGEWTQLAITAGNLRYLSEVAITTGFSVGEQVRALVEFQTDANADTGLVQMEAYIVSTGSTNTAGTFTDTAGYDGTEVVLTKVPRSGVLRTPPMVIGAGTTGLALWVRFWGAPVTVRLGRMAVVKV